MRPPEAKTLAISLTAAHARRLSPRSTHVVQRRARVDPAQGPASGAGRADELVGSANMLDDLQRALAYPKLRSRIDQTEASELVNLLRRASLPFRR